LLSHVDDNELVLELDAANWSVEHYVILHVEDNAGQITNLCIELCPRTSVSVFARFEDSAGQFIEGVHLYLMPQDWVPTTVINLSAAADVSVRLEVPLSLSRCPIAGNFVAVYGSDISSLYTALPIRDWMVPERIHIHPRRLITRH
jgi:hypothetical protein